MPTPAAAIPWWYLPAPQNQTGCGSAAPVVRLPPARRISPSRSRTSLYRNVQAPPAPFPRSGCRSAVGFRQSRGSGALPPAARIYTLPQSVTVPPAARLPPPARRQTCPATPSVLHRADPPGDRRSPGLIPSLKTECPPQYRPWCCHSPAPGEQTRGSPAAAGQRSYRSETPQRRCGKGKGSRKERSSQG